VPGVDYDDDKEEPNDCAHKCQGMPMCKSVGETRYGSEKEALDAATTQHPDLKRPAYDINYDAVEEFKTYPEAQSGHATYNDKSTGKKLFSLMRVPCCTDTPAGPQLTWQWKIAW